MPDSLSNTCLNNEPNYNNHQHFSICFSLIVSIVQRWRHNTNDAEQSHGKSQKREKRVLPQLLILHCKGVCQNLRTLFESVSTQFSYKGKFYSQKQGNKEWLREDSCSGSIFCSVDFSLLISFLIPHTWMVTTFTPKGRTTKKQQRYLLYT